jgi:hypothetical protein
VTGQSAVTGPTVARVRLAPASATAVPVPLAPASVTVARVPVVTVATAARAQVARVPADRAVPAVTRTVQAQAPPTAARAQVARVPVDRVQVDRVPAR